MFDSLQEDSTKCAPLFELNNFIAMATYWVPDLPKIKDISDPPWRSIFIFANGARYTQSNKHINMFFLSLWPCITFFELKITNILKSSGWGLEKSELPWQQ